MKIYITRHGQVESNAEYWGNPNYPKGEVALSELGRLQAKLLGCRLKDMQFKGKIYASPYIRTMETAELIAMETGSEIIPCPGVREIFKVQESAERYHGSSLEELKQLFTGISESAEMEYPWWEAKKEEYEDVRYRVALAMREIRKQDEDVLIVGHGASAEAATHYVLGGKRENTWLSNCGLTIFDTKQKSNFVINCRKHLPYCMISRNREMLVDNVYNIKVPEKLQRERGLKLLHIGDTVSATYPWYRSLIKAIQPDVIIHTGDSADELKVGRKAEDKEAYLDRVQFLVDILKESGSEIYWVPGNNDLPEEIAERAPFFKILQPDTVISLEGKDICVAHSRDQITKKADIYLYGHSSRYEVWSDERNTPESDEWHLNAIWNVYVCILPQRTLYRFERPREEK